jgi:HEAT repeat protein
MLIPCLWDDDPFLRGAAAEALGQLRSTRARDVLKVKAEDPDKWVRQQATAALILIEGRKATSGGGWRPSPAT